MRKSPACLIAIGLAGVVHAQTNIVSLAPDGAWTWFNDPRAIFHNGIFYVGYVSHGNGLGNSSLNAYNPQTGVSTLLWNSPDHVQADDHNNPGLLVRQDGTMLAIHARHGSDPFFIYRFSTSTNPRSPADWTGEFTNQLAGGITYSNPFQLSGENGIVYNFARFGFQPHVLVSTNAGLEWSAPRQLITGSGTRPYLKYSSDYVGRIDFLYTDGHPRNDPNSLYHFYYHGGLLYRTDGSVLKNFADIPIDHNLGEKGSVIYQYSDDPQSDPNQWLPTGRAWSWEIASASNGFPVCVFTVQVDNVTGDSDGSDDRIYYYYARWTGTQWQKRFIAQAGRPMYPAEDDYAGGICIDPKDPNVVYISSNAQNPFDLTTTTNVPLRGQDRYEIFRGVTTNGGLTFLWEGVTTNSSVDNLRPYIPRGQKGPPAVIWFRGVYYTWANFQCEVVGIFPPDTNVFTGWITSYFPGETNVNFVGPGADPDGERVANVVEFVLAGNPTVNDAAAIRPTYSLDDTYLVYEFRRSDASNVPSGYVGDVHYSTDLSNWTKAVNGLDGVIQTDHNDFFGTGIDKVSVQLPRVLAVDGKLFVRFGVSPASP